MKLNPNKPKMELETKKCIDLDSTIFISNGCKFKAIIERDFHAKDDPFIMTFVEIIEWNGREFETR